MSHSLIRADRRTHCKIIALAVSGVSLLVMVGLSARVPERQAAGTIVVRAAGVTVVGEALMLRELTPTTVR